MTPSEVPEPRPEEDAHLGARHCLQVPFFLGPQKLNLDTFPVAYEKQINMDRYKYKFGDVGQLKLTLGVSVGASLEFGLVCRVE